MARVSKLANTLVCLKARVGLVDHGLKVFLQRFNYFLR